MRVNGADDLLLATIRERESKAFVSEPKFFVWKTFHKKAFDLK